ncbi:ATP-binding protein [Aquipuribacter hungaricus]|uniref:ATP-binding protein n=1 Tax=Aquipuribacter hungaricus TaxID=545624 RepID=A0ABV7WFX6_9MICO
MDAGAEIRLPCEASAPRAARRWLRQQLVVDPASSVGDLAELLLTEVVTNVVVHARTASTVRLVEEGDVLCVEVEDGSSSPPRRPRPSGDEDESGRGVELLDALAQRWGWRRRPAGKVVWFCVVEPAA